MNQVVSLADRAGRNLVAPEIAAEEFDRFVDAMDLDVDEKGMDAEDLAKFQDHRRIIVRAMERGQLVIDSEGRAVYTPQGTQDAIVFHEPTGATLIEMDTKKKEQEIAKLIAVMASMTKLAPVTFSKMRYRDLRVCQSIVSLFLG